MMILSSEPRTRTLLAIYAVKLSKGKSYRQRQKMAGAEAHCFPPVYWPG
jgi:hypothetical protein